jgi:MYXO-CTERM domain-containing protein
MLLVACLLLANDFGLVVPPQVTLESELEPAISGTAGGRLDVRGSIEGVPLARRVARIWVGRDGGQLVVVSDPVAPLTTGVEPSIAREDALALLEASGLSGSRGATTARLVVDPDPIESRLAWRVDPPVDPATLDNQVFLVDAHTGAIRVAFNRTRSASVEAYRVNPVETPKAEIFALSEVDATAEFLEGPSFAVRNCTLSSPDVVCVFAPSLVPDVNGDFFYPVPDISIAAKNQVRDDAYAEVSAYYNADRFQKFLADLGDPGLDCSQGDSQTTIRVNVHGFVAGEPEWFSNAFYTGDCGDTVVMGQGEDVDFAWDGEIVLHELGHGITDRQTGEDGTLGLPRRDEHSAGNDAGSINEGTSDFFGTVITGQRIYGDYSGPQFQRDLGTDAACPAGLPGEIHDDGIVWASALLDITDELGTSFVPVVIDTLGMLPFDVSFDVAAQMLETLTRDALGDAAGDLVADVMTERGLTECVRVAPIEDARFGMWLLPATWDVAYNPVRPPPFQVEIAVPPNATSFTVGFEPFDFIPDGQERTWSVDVVVKADEPIIFTYEDAAGLTYVDADSTEQYAFDDDNQWTRDVQGGEVLYAAFLNRGASMMRLDDITIEYELVEGESSSSGPEPQTTGPETSTGETDPVPATSDAEGSTTDRATDGTSSAPSELGDDGCGCRSAGAPGPVAPLLLLPLLARFRKPKSSRRRNARGARRPSADRGCGSGHCAPGPIA